MRRRIAGMGVVGISDPLSGTRPLELGIDRSNLSKESEATQEKTLQDIHALHAAWFRDAVSAVASSSCRRIVRFSGRQAENYFAATDESW